METLDYLIRSLTYTRSCKELEIKKFPEEFVMERTFLNGEIQGINIAITELFKLADERMKEEITLNTKSYNDQVESAMYDAIKFEFPDIKNLKVENGSITFDEGTYTKEQVEAKIAEIKSWGEKLKG